MTPYLDIAVTESSQVGEVRRAASRTAAEQGFGEEMTGRVALVATELATNLVRHAQRGRVLVGGRGAAPSRCVELISLDQGPGMADVQQCLRDGYSTANSPGSGLGAIRRMSSTFSVHSVPGQGSVVLSRLHETGASARTDVPAAIDFAGVCLAAPGETECGDGWDVRVDEGTAAVMVADGLGHGPVAAQASDVALSVFAGTNGSSAGPSAVLERAHAAMRHTRGAAVAIACLDAAAGTIVYSGAGNIAARVISGISDRSLLSQHGTLGVQVRRLHDAHYAWPDHALVILHSDGIATRWSLADAAGLLQCDPAVVAGWLLRDHARGRDDATVVVLKRA